MLAFNNPNQTMRVVVFETGSPNKRGHPADHQLANEKRGHVSRDKEEVVDRKKELFFAAAFGRGPGPVHRGGLRNLE
jgi:hypothetical protein